MAYVARAWRGLRSRARVLRVRTARALRSFGRVGLRTWRGVLGDTDVWIVGGLVLLAVGAGRIYGPAGLIVPGALAFAVGVWLSIPAGRGKDGD